MCKDPTPIEHFWLMRILRNFGAKRNLYFMFSGSASSLSKNRSRATEGADIYRRYKQIQHLKNWKVVRNIMCFIMNVIIAKQKISANLIYLSFSKFSYSQNML